MWNLLGDCRWQAFLNLADCEMKPELTMSAACQSPMRNGCGGRCMNGAQTQRPAAGRSGPVAPGPSRAASPDRTSTTNGYGTLLRSYGGGVRRPIVVASSRLELEVRPGPADLLR